jgi:hypothetical protein
MKHLPITRAGSFSCSKLSIGMIGVHLRTVRDDRLIAALNSTPLTN